MFVNRTGGTESVRYLKGTPEKDGKATNLRAPGRGKGPKKKLGKDLLVDRYCTGGSGQ